MRYFNEHAKLIHLDLTIQWFNISKYTWPVQEKKKNHSFTVQTSNEQTLFKLEHSGGIHSGIVRSKETKGMRSKYV